MSTGFEFLAKLDIDAEAILAEEGLEPGTDSIVYVSGSLVERLGNEGSDVDIFVIGASRPSTPYLITKKRFSIAIRFEGRRRVDFEYWPTAEVESILARLREVKLGEEFVADKLEGVEELFLHRLAIALPLRNPSGLERLRRSLDRECFRKYLVQQAIHRIDGAVEDILGMLDSDDLEVAVFRARDLAGLAFDAYGFHRGNTNSLVKWRPKIAARLTETEEDRAVVHRLWELEFPGDASSVREPRRARQYARDVLDFAERTVNRIQG